MVCVLEVVIPLVSILVIFCVIRLVKDGVRPTAMKHVLGRANALALVLVRKYVIVVITVVLLAVREHVLVHVVVDVRAVMVGALAHVKERVLVHVDVNIILFHYKFIEHPLILVSFFIKSISDFSDLISILIFTQAIIDVIRIDSFIKRCKNLCCIFYV